MEVDFGEMKAFMRAADARMETSGDGTSEFHGLPCFPKVQPG